MNKRGSKRYPFCLPVSDAPPKSLKELISGEIGGRFKADILKIQMMKEM